MITYHGKGLILCDSTFSYKGKTLTGKAIVDSGAMGTALLDRPFAEKLGLPLNLEGYNFGVGGVITSWRSTLDEISIDDIENCSVKETVDVSVSTVPTIRPAVALLGTDFLGASYMNARFSPGSVALRCREGKEIVVPFSKIQPEIRWRSWSEGEAQATIILAVTGVLLGGFIIYSTLNR